MRISSGAKKFNPLCLSLIILIIIGVMVVLFACNNATPIIEITVGGEGVIYAGARLPVSVVIHNVPNLKEDVEFSIIQDSEYAFFEEGMLVLLDDAPVGASFQLAVVIENTLYTKHCIIVNTPVERIELQEVNPMRAGQSQSLEAVFYPTRASENGVEFVILEGGDVASIAEGVLTLNPNAKHSDTVKIVAKSGGKVSNEINITIQSIFAEQITISAKGSLYVGESTQLQCDILPSDTNEGTLVYTIVEGAEIATIASNYIQINESAEVGQRVQFFVQIGGIKSNTLELTVQKKAVEQIHLFVKYMDSFEDSFEVRKGDIRELYAEIAPFNATEQNWSVVVVEGEALVDIAGKSLTFARGQEGDIIKVKARLTEEIGGKQNTYYSEEITFVIQKTPVESVEIIIENGQSVEVAPQETRQVSVQVLPLDATYPQYEITIEEGEEFVDYNEGVYTFKDAQTDSKVKLRAYADGVFSDYIIFTIVPVPVDSVTISTSDPVDELKAGDIVNFDSYVLPLNATYTQLTYSIISGNEHGNITDQGVFVVSTNAKMGTVIVQATSVGGVESNVIILNVKGSFDTYIPSNWKSIDNKPQVFDGYSALILDLSNMPLEANSTTIVFSTDIQYIIIEGGYHNTPASCISNLSMYFLTASTVNVTFKNLGIIITERFGGTVIDFGTKGNIILTIEGDSYIQAGSPYSPYSDSFTVDGEWSAASTNYIRKHGMDGFGGYDGGTAISANNLTINGEGKLTVKAGNGSSGTAGGKGANVPSEITNQTAGKGGRGGYGGNSGFAIFVNTLVFDLEGQIFAYGGDSGKGGEGGAKGIASNPSYSGQKGINGQDGLIHNPIYAYSECSRINGSVNCLYIGQVQDVGETRSDNVVNFVEKLERYFKVDLHYGTDFFNPYKPTLFSWKGYRMTQQNNTQEILKLLHGLEGALCIFPKNMFIELSIVNNAVNIYLVNTIKNSADNTVYGLTSSVNNVWFATFDTRLRDTFYSTYYNIMIHELLHLLTFSMGSTNTNPMKTGLPQFNLGNGYVVNAQGVYDPENGWDATKSAFLTRYSKTDFNEDISDNISIICILVYKADFLEEGRAIYKKSKYIADTYRNFYNSFAYYMPTPWERLTWKY